ncbi:hypothetical protein BDAG_04599 [Burkholderia dolosa AU0158]|nr:hypothetical protein BDAG_04599 [Burkholderia dolosa AU0158]
MARLAHIHRERPLRSHETGVHMNLLRTLIVGNSGSGKSWLAERIAGRMGSTCIDLDSIHWLPGGYNVARERNEAVRLLRDAAKAERWVIEGIYGSLVDEIRTDSTALIWLCLDEGECIENIRRRGIRRGGDAASFAALLDWAATYRSRQGSSSYIGHQKLFDDYGADKQVLRSRGAISAFLDRWAT